MKFWLLSLILYLNREDSPWYCNEQLNQWCHPQFELLKIHYPWTSAASHLKKRFEIATLFNSELKMAPQTLNVFKIDQNETKSIYFLWFLHLTEFKSLGSDVFLLKCTLRLKPTTVPCESQPDSSSSSVKSCSITSWLISDWEDDIIQHYVIDLIHDVSIQLPG